MKEIIAASDLCLVILFDFSMLRKIHLDKVFDYLVAARLTNLGIYEVIEEAAVGVFIHPFDSKQIAEKGM